MTGRRRLAPHLRAFQRIQQHHVSRKIYTRSPWGL